MEGQGHATWVGEGGGTPSHHWTVDLSVCNVARNPCRDLKVRRSRAPVDFDCSGIQHQQEKPPPASCVCPTESHVQPERFTSGTFVFLLSSLLDSC